MFSFLRQKTRRPSTTARMTHHTFRPRLEALEDRCLLSGGVLDPTFGIGGIITTNVASLNDSFANAVATYPNTGTANDGKIVAAGTVTNFQGGTADQDMAVVRYKLDGSLDMSFGGSGEVVTSVGSSRDGAADVKVQPDGKVVVAGWTGGSGSKFALVRYNTDGSLDSSFGVNGIVLTNITKGSTDLALQVAIQPDGKIIAAGTTQPAKSTTKNLAIVRYNADGTLDTSFGTGGKVIRQFSAPLAAYIYGGMDLAIDLSTNPLDSNAGKIMVVAELSQAFPVVLRLNTNGSPDASFGSNGVGCVTVSTLQGSNPAVCLAIQSDDRVVVAGPPSTTQGIELVRYNADGSLDSGFGSGGIAITASALPYAAYSRDLVIQPNGNIVVAGNTGAIGAPVGANNFLVERVNQYGSLDTSFGSDGITTSMGVAVNTYSKVGVALEPDGRIVVAGTAIIAGNYNFALARFLAAEP